MGTEVKNLEKRKKKGTSCTRSVISQHFLDVIASGVKQSHKKNVFSSKRLPCFARNDTFAFDVITKRVTWLVSINTLFPFFLIYFTFLTLLSSPTIRIFGI